MLLHSPLTTGLLAESPPRFAHWGTSHIAALTIIAALSMAAVVVVRRSSSERRRQLSRGFAILLLGTHVPVQIWRMMPPEWDPEYSLPLQLCDLAWMASAWAIWSGSSLPSALVYYWGLTLATQALLTPALPFDFPHRYFIMFWGMHGFIAVATAWIVWGRGFRPGWRGFRRTYAITLAFLLIVLGINEIIDANYMFVSEKPPGASVLDAFGPWPVYLLVEAAVVAVVWALLTLPGVRRPPTSTGSGVTGGSSRPRRGSASS